jgi:hypothetical protein
VKTKDRMKKAEGSEQKQSRKSAMVTSSFLVCYEGSVPVRTRQLGWRGGMLR